MVRIKQNVTDLLEKQTIKCDSVESLDKDKVFRLLEKYPLVRISGIVKASSLLESRRLLKDSFSVENDRATTGETIFDVMGNFQKMSIGSARHGGVERPRFMRVFYNPLFANDIYELHGAFKKVAQVRNLIGGLELNFAIDEPEGGMWTAARVHHFPSGGGFMVSHQDTVLPKVYKSSGIGGYFQPILIMSKYGEDYSSGGGFVEIDGERVLYEHGCDIGDIVIYDSRTVHGVDDIDTKLPYRQDSLEGRMSGLVTLYKDMREGATK